MKKTTCEWCGEDIGPNEVRVKLPNWERPGSTTYHADCYCRIYDKRCLRALLADDHPFGESIGKSLDVLLRALDPTQDDRNDEG